MEEFTVNKFDVAERQLLQAIRMFFRQDDEISVHTLAEAANQVLSDIGSAYSTTSVLRDNDWVREDKKREWLRHLFKSRNFFKHADRDKNDTHVFKSCFNHFSLLDGVSMHGSIKKTWVPETLVFQIWFSTMYPELLIKESEFNKMIFEGIRTGQIPDPQNKLLLFQMITTLRSGISGFPNVKLEYGL